jgi:hypothetical protein
MATATAMADSGPAPGRVRVCVRMRPASDRPEGPERPESASAVVVNAQEQVQPPCSTGWWLWLTD